MGEIFGYCLVGLTVLLMIGVILAVYQGDDDNKLGGV